jgi:hypothetical protein
VTTELHSAFVLAATVLFVSRLKACPKFLDVTTKVDRSQSMADLFKQKAQLLCAPSLPRN